MNLTNEQIQQILSKTGGSDIGVYFDNEGSHYISDLREILTLRQRVQDLEAERDSACRLNDSLSLERDQLTATADRLLKACELAYDNHDKMLMTDPPQCAWKTNQVSARLFEAITLTSQQNLVERDEEATRKAFIAGAEWWAQNELKETLYLDEDEAANEYAERVKRGGLNE